MKIAKMQNGTIVQIVKVQEKVQFSEDTGWILICEDFDKHLFKRTQTKWIRAQTKFLWVKEFIETSE